MEEKILECIAEIFSNFAESYVAIPPRAFAYDAVIELNCIFEKQKIPYYIIESKNASCVYEVFKKCV